MGDDTGLAAKIRQLPCAGCWVEWWRMALELGQLAYWDADGTPMLEHRSEVGHLASRGSGHGVVTARPTKCGHGAGVPNVLPVCRTCHDQQEKRTAAWGREVAEDPEWGWRVAALVAEACA